MSHNPVGREDLTKYFTELKTISHILMRHCCRSGLIFPRNYIDTFMDVCGLWHNIYSEGGGPNALNFNLISICLLCRRWRYSCIQTCICVRVWVDVTVFHPISSECTALKDAKKWSDEKVCLRWWITCPHLRARMFYGAKRDIPALTLLTEAFSEMQHRQF